MSEVRERGLLFGAPMVRALYLNKEATRRGINRLLRFGKITELQASNTPGHDFCFRDKEMRLHDVKMERLLECCPYGKIGERLWGKETYAIARFSLNPEYGDPSYFEWEKDFGDAKEYLNRCSTLFYKADGEDKLPGELTEEKGLWKREIRWRSPRFMPRWASRILLEITNVKVERLQDISEEDAIKEGIENIGYGSIRSYSYDSKNAGFHNNAIAAFRDLWDSINGKDKAKCWDANPFVWGIEFRRVE